jgi:peptidoglycan/LPS O-acetylase OafA/YrhL
VKAGDGRAGRIHLDYMDGFRGFSILLIMLTHVYPWSFLPPWGWNAIQNAAVFFIFIAGFFLRYLYRESETVTGFFRRKASRLIVPYLLSCVPGVLYVWLTAPESRSFGYLVRTVCTGTGHLNDMHWFAPFIILVFAAYPIWRLLMRRDRALLVSTCIALLVGLLTFRSNGNENPLISVVHYSGVFVAGMLAARYHDDLLRLLRGRFRVVVAAGFLVWAITMPFIRHITMEQVLSRRQLAVDLSLLAKLFLVLPLMAIFVRLSDAGRAPTFLRSLAGMSFGLFFWHGYAIPCVDAWGRMLGLHGGWWFIAIRPTLVISLAIGLLAGLHRLSPRLSVYLGTDAMTARWATSRA